MNELQEPLDELIAVAPTLILQFGDEACAPCHAIRYKLEKWLEGQAKVTARYIDIRKNLALCTQMGIFSAPAVVVYMDGILVARESGYFSLDDVLGRLEWYMEMRTSG